MEYKDRYMDRKDSMNPIAVLPDGLAAIVEHLFSKFEF
jgi:hypothetical protein